ncbi:MAG: MetQ/NlpA family ABC transporter substrate-binding protein [Clostridiales bacterium]|nr:MetQ/NlpA family ABC transporter substrate-binding protein [Clostridiales bacterium]
MKKSVKFVTALLTAAILASLTGCSGATDTDTSVAGTEETEETVEAEEAEEAEETEETEEETSEISEYARELKYRRMPTATSDLFEAGIAPILEREGYTLTPVEITDSIQREIALSEDEIDFHVDSHAAYVASFNESYDTDLAPVLPIPTVPTGIYSGSKDDLADIEEGDAIAFPSDASNEARSLLLLSTLGLITMDEDVEQTQYTLADIVENPYNLEFTEMDGSTIPSVREDFAYVILMGSDAYNAGIDFATALAAESQDAILEDNMMELVVNGTHKDEGWVQDIIDAYQSEEFKEFMETQSDFWILPDYLQ